MKDGRKSPEQMTLEELEALIETLSEQMRVIGAEMQPYAQEYKRRKCEANQYLKLLRDGAVIEVEKTIYDDGYFRIDGEDVGLDVALYDLLTCPQVRSVFIEHDGWRYVKRYILKDAPTPEDAIDV